MTPRILCILAGGEGKRIGGSKLRLRVNDQSLAQWQAERLGLGFQRWLSVASLEQMQEAGERMTGWDMIVVDEMQQGGPLRGMLSVLRKAEDEAVVVMVPVDLPLLPRTAVDRLLASMEISAAVLVMGRWRDGERAGELEPMPLAIQAGEGRKLIEQALATRLHGPRDLASLPGSACVYLDWEDEQTWYRDLDTPHDLQELTQSLGAAITMV